MRFKDIGPGGSLLSIELFTRKSVINSLLHSSAIIIGREPCHYTTRIPSRAVRCA